MKLLQTAFEVVLFQPLCPQAGSLSKYVGELATDKHPTSASQLWVCLPAIIAYCMVPCRKYKGV